jgi:hypothetical protein
MNASQPAQGQPPTRKEFRRIMNAVNRSNAPGRDERIAAAVSKRDRRNAKRAAEA